MLRLSARLARSEEGATVVEFALVAPVFLMMVMGLFDMGYNMYTDQMLNGAIQQAARNSALESGAGAVAALDNNVSQAVGAIAYGATMTFERKSFSSFRTWFTAKIFQTSTKTALAILANHMKMPTAMAPGMHSKGQPVWAARAMRWSIP